MKQLVFQLKNFWIKPKNVHFLGRSNEHKIEKGVHKNVVPKISHNEFKNVLLNLKFLRHSMKTIQSKNNGIETYEISKISLSCFDDKIYIQNNGYDRLALGYRS